MFMFLLCLTFFAKLLQKIIIVYIYISILCTYIYQIFHQISFLQRKILKSCTFALKSELQIRPQ